MKNTQKGFIVPLLLAIIVVLAIGGGIYVYTQNRSQQVNDSQTTTQNTQPVTTSTNQLITNSNASSSNQTTGWKTYTNKQYGFSFQYPSVGKVVSGTHYGGGIQDVGEVQFAIQYQSKIGQAGPTDGLIIFSVKPTKYQNNAQLLSYEQDYINSNSNIRNIWQVNQVNFLNIGQAVILSDVNNSSNPSGCKPTGTLSESVYAVKAPYLFTFDDYRCNGYTQTVIDVMNTFKFTAPI